MMDRSRMTALFRKYAEKTATEAERIEFFSWLETPESAPLLNELVDAWIWESAVEKEMPAATADAVLQSIFTAAPKVKPVRRFRWAPYAAAAALLLAAVTYYWPPQPASPVDIVTTAPAVIVPASNKAVLTLGDGSQVVLDSAGHRQIVNGSVAAQQSGGSLQYGPSEEVQYHTLTTPRGGQFNVTLPDGTQVWLNAASAISYPTAFNGSERVVHVTGEVYMEVAARAQQPFIVETPNGGRVEVLGTSFNINAYADEPDQRITLVTGSVRYEAGNATRVLKPGQQGVWHKGLINVELVELQEVLAWKNGLFYFNDASLPEVMRQLSRWYDIDVQYQGAIPQRMFEGKMERSLSLEDVLYGLGKNKVHYRIEGRKIIMLP